VLQPLPEKSEFVVEATNSLPQQGRVTTAQLRGSLRGRGRGRVLATDKGRGRGRGSTTVPTGRAR
jgi:hypothetical protein